MRQVPPGWCTVMAVRRMNASSAVVFDALPGRQLVEHEITQRRLTHQVARDAHRIAHLFPVFLAGQEVLVDARRGQRIRARHRDAAPAARMQQDGAHGEAVLERLAPGLEPGRAVNGAAVSRNCRSGVSMPSGCTKPTTPPGTSPAKPSPPR